MPHRCKISEGSQFFLKKKKGLHKFHQFFKLVKKVNQHVNLSLTPGSHAQAFRGVERKAGRNLDTWNLGTSRCEASDDEREQSGVEHFHCGDRWICNNTIALRDSSSSAVQFLQPIVFILVLHTQVSPYTAHLKTEVS